MPLRQSQWDHIIRSLIPHDRYHSCLFLTPDERNLMVYREGADIASPEAQFDSIKDQVWLRHP